MDTKVIELGYASDLERSISAELHETIKAQTIAQTQRETTFLSTVRSRVKRTMYQNIYAFLNTATPQIRYSRGQLLDWFKLGMQKLFPTAESACFMPNANKIPFWGISGNELRNPNPVIKRAAELEKILFSRSPFDILDFARKHLDTLPYIDSQKVDKKIEQIVTADKQNILIIPIGESNAELLGCLYVQLLVPLEPKKLQALNDLVYPGRKANELTEKLSTALLYTAYPALYDMSL